MVDKLSDPIDHPKWVFALSIGLLYSILASKQMTQMPRDAHTISLGPCSHSWQVTSDKSFPPVSTSLQYCRQRSIIPPPLGFRVPIFDTYQIILDSWPAIYRSPALGEFHSNENGTVWALAAGMRDKSAAVKMIKAVGSAGQVVNRIVFLNTRWTVTV